MCVTLTLYFCQTNKECSGCGVGFGFEGVESGGVVSGPDQDSAEMWKQIKEPLRFQAQVRLSPNPQPLTPNLITLNPHPYTLNPDPSPVNP